MEAPTEGEADKAVKSPQNQNEKGALTSRSTRTLPTNFRTEEVRGYLFKKTRDGKWQKRWFETNGCFLTYYKKQGQKLLAALNLPQVGTIALMAEDAPDGPGLFTIELNERVYTIKARSQEEASFWVEALLWRQAGGVVTQKSPDVTRSVGSSIDEHTNDDHVGLQQDTVPSHAVEEEALTAEEVKRSGGCASCCVIQ